MTKIEKDKYFENKYKAKKVIANLLFILDIKNNKIDNENMILTHVYGIIRRSFFNEEKLSYGLLENLNSLTLIKKSKLKKIINSIQKKYNITEIKIQDKNISFAELNHVATKKDLEYFRNELIKKFEDTVEYVNNYYDELDFKAYKDVDPYCL